MIAMTIKSRPSTLAILIFILALIPILSLINQNENDRVMVEMAEAEAIAVNHAKILHLNLDHALSATRALASLVRQGNGQIPNFNDIAREMLELYPGVANLQLAEQGKVSKIYPPTGKKIAAGHSKFNDSLHAAESRLAMETGEMTLTGPYPLVQKGTGALGRMPIYLKGDQDKFVFWGFSAVLIDLDRLLEQTNIRALEAQGYAYRLWKEDPENGQKQTIFASAQRPGNPVDVSIQIANTEWTLSIAPLVGWHQDSMLVLRIIFGVLLAALFAFLVKTLAELQLNKQHLEDEIRRRTGDLKLEMEENRKNTAALRVSESKFRHLTESSPAIIYQFRLEEDGSPSFQYFNVDIEQALGIESRGDRTDTELIFTALHPNDRQELVERIRESARTMTPYIQVLRFNVRGTTLWMDSRSVPERLEDGTMIWNGLSVNVTALFLAQEALQKSEERNRAFLDAIPDMMFIMDGSGRFVDFSAGIDAPVAAVENFIMHNVAEVLPPDVASLTMEKLSEVFEYQDVRIFEYSLETEQGLQWFESRLAPCGDSTVMAIVRNITTKKSDEKELNILYSALDQSPTAFIITDAKGFIEYVNPKFSSMTGYSRQDVMGLKPSFLKSGGPEDTIYPELWRSITSGKIWSGDLQNRRKDGSLFWERITIGPVFSPDRQLSHFVATAEDIEKTKLLEEQLRQSQKLEEIGHLAGGIAHDFNNILSAQYGFSEMALKNIPPDSRALKAVQQIQKANERAAKLVKQILAFGRKQIYTPVSLDISHTLGDLSKMMNRLIGEDIEIQLNFPSNPLFINADPSQIEQILINLAVNARDAIRRNKSTHLKREFSVTAEAMTVDDSGFRYEDSPLPGTYVLMTFSDTGIGMDKNTLKRIFEPFFTTKEVGQGTGLGLSTVYGIIKQNRGYITVYSEPGAGTTFRIYWPTSESLPAEDRKPSASVVEIKGRERILLAEDDTMLREVTEQYLTDMGYRVLACTNGQEALETAEKHKYEFDILVTDVTMPRMSGRDLAEQLLLKKPGLNVLLCSGYNEEINQDHTRFPFLVKPFTTRELAGRIREIMDKTESIPSH